MARCGRRTYLGTLLESRTSFRDVATHQLTATNAKLSLLGVLMFPGGRVKLKGGILRAVYKSYVGLSFSFSTSISKVGTQLRTRNPEVQRPILRDHGSPFAGDRLQGMRLSASGTLTLVITTIVKSPSSYLF